MGKASNPGPGRGVQNVRRREKNPAAEEPGAEELRRGRGPEGGQPGRSEAWMTSAAVHLPPVPHTLPLGRPTFSLYFSRSPPPLSLSLALSSFLHQSGPQTEGELSDRDK